MRHGLLLTLLLGLLPSALSAAEPPALAAEKVEATQSQVAATLAHLLGEDFATASPRAALPLAGVRRTQKVGSR